MAVVGVGPGMIEHQFAIGIGLAVTGNRAHQHILTPTALQGDEVLREPTPMLADASMALQRRQEFVFEEGVVILEQGVPGRGGDCFQAFDLDHFQVLLGHVFLFSFCKLS